MKSSFKFRLRLIYFFIFILAALLVTRLFFVQVVKRNYYKSLANNQYVALSGEQFNRGTIYFKSKDGQLISAASIKDGFLVAITPKLIEGDNAAYQKLSGVINLDKKDFLLRVAKKSDPYEVVARHLSEDDAEKVKALSLKGVNVYSEKWRYYPADNLASQVLGFVGYKNDKLEGRYGIEKNQEGVLKRQTDEKMSNSFFEIFGDIKKIITNDLESGDIALTIEPTVQSNFEKTLSGLMEKYKAEMAGGIIIDPKTGNILAMASKPDFNPNGYGDVKNMSVFSNSMVESIFEPGSIMKPLTVAASLNEGRITASTTYRDNGFLVFDKSRIENYDGKARGVVDMQEVLNKSLNTGAVFAMQRLGKEKFREYLVSYGFNETTGIDLPGEVKGMISNVLKSPRDIEYATASFGQGISVTPIQMAIALSSLANGGFIMKPHIIDEIKTEELTGKKSSPEIVRSVLKKETSEEITRMLVKVVDVALLEGKYKNEHYSVAAKTGTAQLSNIGEKGYNKLKYVHTFFGYAPAYNPKFLTLLYLVGPQGVQYASHSLTEPFINITNFLLNYYEVAPDR